MLDLIYPLKGEPVPRPTQNPVELPVSIHHSLSFKAETWLRGNSLVRCIAPIGNGAVGIAAMNAACLEAPCTKSEETERRF